MKKHMVNETIEAANVVKGTVPSKPLMRKRVKQWLSDYKWPLIGFMWLVTIALGFIGFRDHYTSIGITQSNWDYLYHTLQLFVLDFSSVSGPIGWELQVARFLAPVLTLFTAAQALLIILHDQVQILRIRLLKDHTVICGLGRKGLLLADGFGKRGDRVVVIEQNQNNDMLEQCKEYGAIILIGNAVDPAMLYKARVHKAKNLISVCGDDGTNAEVAVHARELVSAGRGRALSCLVHIVDLNLCRLLREREIAMGKLDAFRLEFFNVFESGAKVLLNMYPPTGIKLPDRLSTPHMIVVGVGRLGESVIVNAARVWHEKHNVSKERMQITLIDKYADSKKDSLCQQYPRLEDASELIPLQIDIEGPEFDRAEFLFDSQGSCTVTSIYVCLDNDSPALSAALKMYQRTRDLEVPIIVRTGHDAGLATLLRGEQEKRVSFANVLAFGLLDHTCTPDLIYSCTYEMLARAMHERYLKNLETQGFTSKTHRSMVPWEQLSELYRESNRKQAEHIRMKLEAISCDILVNTDWDAPLFQFKPEEVESLSKMEHDRYVGERLKAGEKYGPIKDTNKGTNPTLIPWDELPEQEKDKDRDSVRVIPELLRIAGFEVYRLKDHAGNMT